MRRHGGGGQEGQEGERSPARPAAGPGRGVGDPSGRAGGGAGWDRGQVGLRLARKCRAFPGEGVPLAARPGPAQTAIQGALLRAAGWGRRGSGPSEGPGGGQDCAVTGEAFYCPLGFVFGCAVKAEMGSASRPVCSSTVART